MGIREREGEGVRDTRRKGRDGEGGNEVSGSHEEQYEGERGRMQEEEW